MAILAASIITRSGKAILSRQFKELTKNRITELLANFPALLSENNTQHTTVEDEHVRYVYQPLDDLYILLITNRQSNILQDIETLSLFAETVTSLLRVVNENEIFDHAFEILSAMDEIVTLGYRENLSFIQIKAFLEMDSHEEKIQDIIELNKQMEATEERKRRAKEIQRKERDRRNNQFNTPAGFQGGMGSTNSFAPTQDYSAPQTNYAPTPVDPTPSHRPAPRGRGLQLGKSKKSSFEPSSAPLISEPELPRQSIQEPQQQYQSARQEATPPVDDKPLNNGILVTLEEKVTAEITREGSIVSSELKGVLQLRINDPELALAKILLEAKKDDGVQFKTHPNVDRNLFAGSSVIGLKNPEKPFPSNDQNLGVLRWRGVGKADDNKYVPIQFTTWLTANGNSTDVTLEFELNDSYNEAITNITILVPVYTDNVELKSENAQISEISDEGIIFQLESLSPGENGVLEFSIGANEDDLFPIEVSFTSENPVNTLGHVKVLDVVSVSDEESLPFDLISELTTDGYFIV
ncbi:coatomer subunit delta CYBJADRAFT_127497 [Cyberlindnera jadinii NRRL Y-1542]|uniref:Coatomer subunit delta n=1 Tax=Cyberlindnera jadinii (strain ATCC 18201 / CBS 1600 / BCRC 20928 / JCM 3617 / NBRC 0987 / NRRL Y-1542) TaxID=983966 RepID=A0A1E4S2M1_CYBJN|nr:hypothetical protein CYBJADRAFT_127497 [Cyberlindnera jadinii NRRL Y-1542]ODV73672.1 hypothetical protein CYBJADRAFT_127497 [Cyberlindnera jadinii NRRL Y-1542]